MTVRLCGISKSFGAVSVLRELDACFSSGRPTCVMGPSGCGKTTLLRILMGLEGIDGGRIEGLSGLRAAPVFQEDRLCDGLSVFLNASIACPRGARADVSAELEAVGLGGWESVPAGKLSGGMKRRVAIVRALTAQSDIVLLDEPFKGLDGASKRAVAARILARTEGKIVVAATHDAEDVELLGADTAELPNLSRSRHSS